MSRRTALTRRTLLRGMAGGTAVSLALPPLEAMFDGHGEALADGTVAGPIFGVFFWANGLPWHAAHTRSAANDPGFNGSVHRDLWTPAQTGAGYTPSTLLQPLAPYTPSVVTGLEPKTSWVTSGETDGHMRGFMVALTGDRVNPDGFHHNSHTLTASRESIDQFVAKHPDFYGANTPRYRSVHVGVSGSRFHDYGHWNAISYNGPWSLNPPVDDAGLLFDQLFGSPAADGPLRRADLIDAVLDDFDAVKAKLGAADKLRLEDHLEHLFEVQRRLDAEVVGCPAPTRPNDTIDLVDQTRTLADLLALGLSCGTTRVFTFMLTSPATTHLFSGLGSVRNGMHATCHNGEWDNVRAITAYQMRAFAAFLERLSATQLTMTSSVLDGALVFGTSEYGEGWKHGVQEMPVVFAGGASLGMVQGHHVREAGGNLSKAHVTALRAIGLDVPTYGFNGGETSEAFSELTV